MNAPADRSTALFVSLILGLMQAGYQQLGKLKNELTGKIERNLEAARMTIDTLAAVEARTRGNLSEEETTVLHRALTELRLNYVAELKKPAVSEEAKPTDEAKPTETKPPDPPASEETKASS
jgi:hypothetical protein